MDGEIKTHQFSELLVVSIAQHASEVGRPIEFWVNGSNAFAVTVSVTIDRGSDDRELGNEIHAVFVDVFPVFAFMNALTLKQIRLDKRTNQSTEFSFSPLSKPSRTCSHDSKP